MKWPWAKSETKTAQSLVALAHLPISAWGQIDPSALLQDGYRGNAVAYRCVRMIAEAAATIDWQSDDERVAQLLLEPSPDESGQALLERLYIDLQITGNAWLEAVTLPGESVPRGLYPLRVDRVRVRQNPRGRVIGYGVQIKQGERLVVPDADGDSWNRRDRPLSCRHRIRDYRCAGSHRQRYYWPSPRDHRRAMGESRAG